MWEKEKLKMKSPGGTRCAWSKNLVLRRRSVTWEKDRRNQASKRWKEERVLKEKLLQPAIS